MKKNVLFAGAGAVSVIALAIVGCISTPQGRGLFIPFVTTNATGALSTNYIVNPGVTNAIGTAQGVAQAFPWGGLLATAFGGATTVLGVIAKKKSEQAAMLPVLIAGVEAAENNADVKTSIKRIASATGVEQRLKRVVRQVKTAKARADFGERP